MKAVKRCFTPWCAGVWMTGVAACAGATLTGSVRDQNWFAQYLENPVGVGYYEFAVNANAIGSTEPGGAAATDIFGRFQMLGLPAGTYTVASWDVWWRSAFAFNVPVTPASTAEADLRLGATMWGYPAFWDDSGYYEFGQTFVATGPIAMIYLRCPVFAGAPVYTLTVHEGGPGGKQIGVARVFGAGDQRPVYGYGEMPTQRGQTYYARIRAPRSGSAGVIMQMEPRPDFSDPMPGGCLWLGDGVNPPTPFPDRDLGLVIMSDDDGLLTNMFTRPGSESVSGTTLGQSFVARGVNLISAAFWLADPGAPSYRVQPRRGGPSGELVGPAKVGKPARVTADPEMIVTWAAEECPVNPGQAYFLEVTRLDGGMINNALLAAGDAFAHGLAFHNGQPLPAADLAGTIMEEERFDSATQPAVRFTAEPSVAENERAPDQLTVRWTTDAPADSKVEFAANHPPYTRAVSDSTLRTSHALVLSRLSPHKLYHFRVTSGAAGRRPAVSRDFVVCTRASQPNLLASPGFEEGAGTSPRRAIAGWDREGSVDLACSDGSWFWGLPPHSGQWLLEGAVNGASSDGHVYQRVAVAPGKHYTFSAWVTTWPRENGTWKYDVWNDRNRLIHVRLGMDPTGGTDPRASTVQWTPRFYSHRRYSNPALTVTAQSDQLTAFIAMQGQGVQWHLYGVDDCALTEASAEPPRLAAPRREANGTFTFELSGESLLGATIETSPDLKAWEAVETVPVGAGVTRRADPDSVFFDQRFYRVVLP